MGELLEGEKLKRNGGWNVVEQSRIFGFWTMEFLYHGRAWF